MQVKWFFKWRLVYIVATLFSLVTAQDDAFGLALFHLYVLWLMDDARPKEGLVLCCASHVPRIFIICLYIASPSSTQLPLAEYVRIANYVVMELLSCWTSQVPQGPEQDFGSPARLAEIGVWMVSWCSIGFAQAGFHRHQQTMFTIMSFHFAFAKWSTLAQSVVFFLCLCWLYGQLPELAWFPTWLAALFLSVALVLRCCALS